MSRRPWESDTFTYPQRIHFVIGKVIVPLLADIHWYGSHIDINDFPLLMSLSLQCPVFVISQSADAD